MERPDIIFVSETSVGYDAIPEFEFYAKYADKDVQILNHGGIALYVNKKLAPHVFNLSFHTSFVAFRLDFVPTLVFIGCYVQPESSKYFDPSLFSELCSFLISTRERKLTPIMGGDMNCRFGDLNNLCSAGNLAYEQNVDVDSNKHGLIYGTDVCTVSDVFPLNHLVHKGRSYEGDFTYHKAGRKSQIDFVFTSKEGLQFVKHFSIIRDNWHLSDHRPICLEISASRMINSSFLLRRAKELNYEFNPHRTLITRHLGSYDFNLFNTYLHENENTIHEEILSELHNCNINRALIKLNLHMHAAHQLSKIKIPKDDELPRIQMERANTAFETYQDSLVGNSIDTPEETYRRYQKARNAISGDMYKSESDKWNNLVSSESSKTLWENIDWKGNLSKDVGNRPTNDELASHFATLYACDDPEEAADIERLQTENYVPALDDPITKKEMDCAMKEMKKGGYDYSLSILRLLVNYMSPILLLLFNIMFYVSYPATLATSLLCALPKKGNLSLPVNYRGIQMLAALSALYDRIITLRLQIWSGVSYVQSAFQKGKSTILPLFTIRLLTAIAKCTGTTLYIGFFDLEKAFDKVSRHLLLKKLIDRGIGNCMLQALKRVYCFTSCIIGAASNASDEFRTYSGIRQGAPSSVLLFIFFMDELVAHLQHHCIEEPLIKTMHCLLHADDTAILSTDRELFIKKCNAMVDYFDENSLKLNLKKSAFLIINGGANDTKDNIQLNFGMLAYQSSVVYLGAVVSDCGSITFDIEKFICGKRPNVTIKYNNFVRKNHLAPLSIKLEVLDVCASSSLVYACETWGTASVSALEVAYRFGLKRALSVRENTNTEMIYIESDRYPLALRVSKQQLKFWITLNEYLLENPEHPLAALIKQGRDMNLKYTAYYDNLEREFQTPEECEKQLRERYRNDWDARIRQKAGSDEQSRCGVYLLVNPGLTPPTRKPNLLELERILLSRYRCGSHNLRIETGRMCNPFLPRDERYCCCNSGVQSLHHVLFECPLTATIREEYAYTSIEEAFKEDDITQLLLKMELELGVNSSC